MYNPETSPISLFFKALKENHTGIIAVTLVGSACYMWINNQEVPKMLENLTLIVVSFHFGTKVKK